MYNQENPNSFTTYRQLFIDGGKTLVGTLATEYTVRRIRNVQSKDLGSSNRSIKEKYLFSVSQRININNPKGTNISAVEGLIAYLGYPALLNASVSLAMPKNAKSWIIDYFPKTVNTQINLSANQGGANGESTSNSRSQSSGSSTSQTNDFSIGGSVGGGLMGDIPSLSASVSASYSQSSTNEHSNSDTMSAGHSNSQSNNHDEGASMSVKDWGAYSLIEPSTQAVNWIFGQEFPWNSIMCRNANPSLTSKMVTTSTGKLLFPASMPTQISLVMPTGMIFNLYDQVFLTPPSQLSQFGINFIMKAMWEVEIPLTEDDEINVDHSFYYYTGSHLLDKGTTVQVFIDQSAAELQNDQGTPVQTKINLAVMALHPIVDDEVSSVVGFIPNKFQRKPQVVTKGKAIPFKITSTAYNLLVKDTSNYKVKLQDGSGFDSKESGLEANFNGTCKKLNFSIYFKVVDEITNFRLFMKHWKVGKSDFKLTLTVNNDPDNTIVKYVTEEEAEGGEANLLTLSLRNQSYASINYHDYLQPGLNVISVMIEPLELKAKETPIYHIRALSVEEQ